MRGPLIFGKSPMGGHLFLASPIFKKPAKPIFLRVSGKNKTKKNFDKKFLGGALIFGGLGRGGPLIFGKVREPKSPAPLHINNERSLNVCFVWISYITFMSNHVRLACSTYMLMAKLILHPTP